MQDKEVAAKLIDSLQTDLKTLSMEAKKRHSNIKDSAEELLMRLKGAQADPLGSLPIVAPTMVHLLLQGCETKDPKIVKACLSAIQKLIVNGLMDEKNTKHLSDTLWMLTEGGIEEVRVLQTVTLLLTTSDIARGITLSKCLVICFNLHFVRGDQTVVNTASATVRQLVSLVFERILSEDKPPDGAVKEPGGDVAAVATKLEDLKVAKGVPPKGLQPFAGDAFLLFQDLVSLVNGDQPSWLIGMNEMTRTFGLELLEMILSTYPAVFFSHPEFVFLLKERVCALVIKLFSPNVKHQSRGTPSQQGQVQDKPYYPVSLRLLRLVTVLVQKYYKLLVTECEIFLSLLVKFLDPDRAVWQRCLALEALHKLLAQPNLLKSIVTSYDLKPHATPILQDTVNALAAYIQSVFVLQQVNTGVAVPASPTNQAQGSQGNAPNPGSNGLSGFYYRGVWMPLLTSLLSGPQRTSFLDILDKLEPPIIPDGYGISVAYACLLSVIKSVTTLIEEENGGDGDITSTDREEKKLKVQLINSSWCGLLTALSLLLEASTDEVGTDSLLKALECVAGLSGRIGLQIPRDAVVTAICKAALPPHYALAVLGVASASKGHSRTGSTDQAYYQSLQQQANDNDYRPHVVAVGTPLPTPGMPQGLQQGPVMLTAKNLQVMRSILSMAQTHGTVLETSWNVVLVTLQHLSWILGIKPIAGAMKGGRNPLVDTNNVLTTAVMADLPIVSSMMAELFETSNRLDESSLRHLLDGLCKLSSDAMEVAYSNREPSFFGIAKLLETSLVNLHRLELLWKPVTNHLLQVAFHPSSRLREWGVEALTSLIRAAVSVKFDPPLKQNQKIQALLLSPLVDLSTTTHADVRQRQLDCVLGVLHACGESLTHGWPLILDIVGAVNANQSESLVRAAFQCMQLVVTDFLPIVPIQCLPLIVETVGRFGSQTQELNVSLTSIGMLWNVSDYFYQNREVLKKSMAGEPKGFPDLTSMPNLQPFDRLWMCLYMKLGDFCVDERPAVRKSAGQTLFSTVSAHGGLLQNETWQAVFWQVLFPLLGKVESLSTVASDQKVDANGTILMHHSRNTAQKQWAETQVLTLSGVARVFNSKRSLLHQLGDFDRGWTLLLRHIEKGALSRNSEVSLSALKSLQELLLVNSKNSEKSEDQWLQAWTVTINIGATVTTPSSEKDVFVASQQFLTSLVLIYPALFQHIKNRFTNEYLDRLFGVLNNVVSVPVHSDASPFVLPPITDNVLTPLQEGILCCIDCIQDAATQGTNENPLRSLLPPIFKELIFFVSFTCKVPSYASLDVRPVQTFRSNQGGEWIQPNFVPFGEKALSMVVALYKKTAKEQTVIEHNVLTEIVVGIRAPLRLKHSHPSHSSWRIASEALIIILRLGLEGIRTTDSEDNPFWKELPVTLEQFLFPESSPENASADLGNEDSVDCKIVLLLKEEILKNPSVFPSHFLLSLTKLLNRGSVQSIAFDCESSVKIREGFARVCFETLLQLSLTGLADFNFSPHSSEGDSQPSNQNGEASTNGGMESVTNRLAVTALLHRFEDVLKRYVKDERLGGKCPLPKHRVVEVTFVLQAISTLGRSLQNAQVEKVDIQTWTQLIALYPYLVELTEFGSGAVGKSLRDALLTYLGLLTAPQHHSTS